MSSKTTRWAFNLSKWQPTHNEMLLATSCIQAEEKERLAKFVYKNDFKSSLIGRLMLRKYANEFSRQPYNEIKFVRDEKGKPLLLTPNNHSLLNYNVSHHGNFTVMVGLEGDLLLGVDVMKFEFPRSKSLQEYFRVMSRTFSKNEWDVIKGAGTDFNQLVMFCRHWCLKESYLKAVGVGITINLQDVSFKINTSALTAEQVVCDTQVYVRGELLNWEFQETLLDQEHCVVVALSSKIGQKDNFHEINMDNLLSNAVPLLPSDTEYCNNFFKKLEKS